MPTPQDAQADRERIGTALTEAIIQNANASANASKSISSANAAQAYAAAASHLTEAMKALGL